MSSNGASSRAEIDARLAVAASELERVDQFDYVVINREGHLDDAVSQICAIIAAEKQRVFPRRVRL